MNNRIVTPASKASGKTGIVCVFQNTVNCAEKNGEIHMVRAIDFFCGAGGLTRGLLDAGIYVVGGVDNDSRVGKTYEKNNNPSRFIHADIQQVDIIQLRDALGFSHEEPTLYTACTPCQPFSTMNTLRKLDDRRKTLLLDFANIIEQAPPDYLIVENVPGLNNAAGKDIYERFEKSLERLGFRKDAELIDAKDFGVPQTRKRFVLIASRHAQPSLPTPWTRQAYATVEDAIREYPVINHGEENAEFKNHIARKLPPHHLRIVEAVPFNGGSRSDVADTSILLRCHQENPKAHKDVFGRMSWNLPAPTLTCRCTDVYCGRFIHPDQHRGISLREAAAIQTFNDDYEFFGKSILEKARQIGNAVPVSLAEQLGRSILNGQATTPNP